LLNNSERSSEKKIKKRFDNKKNISYLCKTIREEVLKKNKKRFGGL
jgi:hypothetical protein